MWCPKCGQRQVCPCKTCSEDRRNKSDQTAPWIKHSEEVLMECVKCGLKRDPGWWETLAADITKEDRAQRLREK